MSPAVPRLPPSRRVPGFGPARNPLRDAGRDRLRRRVCRTGGRARPDPDRDRQQRRFHPSRLSARRDGPPAQTNPLCAAVPTDDGPVVLDFGTSVVAEGKVRVHYFNDKKPVPDGWLLDAEGLPTNDPSILYEAPPRPYPPDGRPAGYTGFGLSLVRGMISGGLTGGRSSYPDAPPAKGNNVVFLLLDPAHFAGMETLLVESSRELCPFDSQSGRGRSHPLVRRPRTHGAKTPLCRGNPARKRPLGKAGYARGDARGRSADCRLMTNSLDQNALPQRMRTFA